MAGVRILFDLVDIRCVCVHNKLIHRVVVIAVFRRVVYQHFLDLFVLGRLEVVQNGVPELLSCDPLFIVDQLFDGGEAVCHIGDADLQAGNEVVNGAALLDGAAAGDAVVRQCRAEHVGDVTLRCLVDKVLYDHAVSGHFTQRLFPCRHQLVVGGHVLERTITLDEALAGGQIDAVVHDAKQQAGEVDVGHAGAAVAPLAGNGRLDAADRAVVVGILLGNAPVDKRGNDDLIVIECRHAEAKTHDLDAFVKELRVKVFVIADGQVGLRQARLRDGLKHHKAQFVDGILLIGGLTADGHILVHRRAGGAERVRLRAELVDGQGLDPQAGQKLERGLPGEPAGLHIRLIVGIHILIKASVAQGVTVGFDLKDELDEPH